MQLASDLEDKIKLCEWLLFNDNWEIFQLYHGENMGDDEVRFVPDQQA